MVRFISTSMDAAAMDRPRRNAQPPERFGGQPAAGRRSNSVWTDEEDETEEEDELSSYNEQPTTYTDNQKDRDYKVAPPQPQTTTKGRPRKVKPESLNQTELLEHYLKLERTLKDVRAKRTEDRKLGRTEKSNRTLLQAQERQSREEIRDLQGKLQQQKVDFVTASEQQKHAFARAQKEWLSKIDMQKYQCLPDNVLQKKFQELYSKCRDWARQWLKEDFVDDPKKFDCILAECCNQKDPRLLPVAIRKYRALKPNAIRLMGFAQLGRIVNRYFFANPFSLLPDAERASLDTLYRFYKRG